MALSQNKRRAWRKAFTLIELLVICAIVGILGMLILSKVQRALWKAREGSTFYNLYFYRNCLNMYAIDHHDPETWNTGVGDYVLPCWVIVSSTWWQFIDPRTQSPIGGSYIYGGTPFKVGGGMQKYMPMPDPPMTFVGRDGKPPTDATGRYANCIWYSSVDLNGTVPYFGNNSGWWYFRYGAASAAYVSDTKMFVINNNSRSTENRPYYSY